MCRVGFLLNALSESLIKAFAKTLGFVTLEACRSPLRAPPYPLRCGSQGSELNYRSEFNWRIFLDK